MKFSNQMGISFDNYRDAREKLSEPWCLRALVANNKTLNHQATKTRSNTKRKNLSEPWCLRALVANNKTLNHQATKTRSSTKRK